MRTPLTAASPTPHQRRHTSQPHVVKEEPRATCDDYDERATCPMCGLPMHVCDGHPLLTDAELLKDYIQRNGFAAAYELQARLFGGDQMAALSPEAARYERKRVVRE